MQKWLRSNPRTIALKKIIVAARRSVLLRDANTFVGSRPVLGACFFVFTKTGCRGSQSAEQLHEIQPRGRGRRESQAKYFVSQNQCFICYEDEMRAQTKEGRAELQDAMHLVFGYNYNADGFWNGFEDAKGVR